MAISYIEYQFTITPKDPATEILMAELGETGFESFVETEDGLLPTFKRNYGLKMS